MSKINQMKGGNYSRLFDRFFSRFSVVRQTLHITVAALGYVWSGMQDLEGQSTCGMQLQASFCLLNCREALFRKSLPSLLDVSSQSSTAIAMGSQFILLPKNMQ